MRIPSEQKFSIVVRSVAAGFRRLDISTGATSRIRFSSRPDRTGICEMAFQSWVQIACTGLGGAEKLQEPTRNSATMIL